MAHGVARRGLPRELRATTYLIAFVVATVATVLVTRGVLAAAGFPEREVVPSEVIPPPP